MRNPVPLLVLALIAWLGFGAYLYEQNCCAATSPLLIKDGALTVASHASNLHFGLTGAKANIPPDIKAEFEKVAAYLGKNPNKTMNLVGQYGSDEQYKGDFANLGLARADDIKKYLIGLGVAATQLTTSAEINNKLNIVDDKVLGGILYNFKTLEIPGKAISISDASAFTKATDDNLVFTRNGFNYKTPLSDKLNGVYGGTAEYLKAHPDRSIKLTGLYQKEEENTSAFPNLGLARANSVKDILIGLGVAAKQIDVQGKEVAGLSFFKDDLIGGIDYTFFATPKGEDDRLARIEKMLRATPLVLYFETNESNLDLSAAQRQYFADLIYYLDNKAGSTVNSTGHTDNKGVVKNNTRLGRKRAEFVRDYLNRNGIPAKKISVVSKGQDEPIESNETREGRKKNRRVEVSIN